MLRIMVVLLCLTISGCSIVNKVRLMSANDNLKPKWSSGALVANPQADFVYAKPYVFATINGVSGLKMLIDTGSSISMLFDTDLVKSMELQQGYELEVGGLGGTQNTKAYQTEVSSIELDSIKFNNVHVGYIPISQTKFFLRRDQVGFDGVIGNDLLKELVWYFDRDRQKITIYQSLPDDLDISNATVLPFTPFFGKISFPATIFFQDHQLSRDIILDTGSRYHMSITSGYFDDGNYPQPRILSAGYSLSGISTHHKVNLPMLQIGELSLKNIATNIIQEDEDDFWTVGSALLSQFQIIVDYPRRKLMFVPRETHIFESVYNLVGLELRKVKSGNFIVGFSSPDLPSKALNFEIGTEITSINGTPSGLLSIDDWLALASREGEFVFCTTQSDNCKAINVSQIPGYSQH